MSKNKQHEKLVSTLGGNVSKGQQKPGNSPCNSGTKTSLFVHSVKFFCSRYNHVAMLALLILIVFLTYGHALKGPFVFDDIPNIVENPHVHINTISFQELRDALFKSPMATRPLANLSFAFNYLFNGTNVSAYRLVNFFIHVGNGLLLYIFLNITLRLPVNKKWNNAPFEIAFCTTVLWFVHPLHVQSVTYVVQRMNSLATFFYLLTFIFYLHARHSERENQAWVWSGFGVIAFFMAIGSKEIAITLPLYIVLYEWFFFQDLKFSWIKANLRRFIGIALLVGTLALSFIGLDPVDTVISSYKDRHFTLTQRLLTETRVVLHYIDLLLFPLPSRLSLLHEFDISTSFLKPATTLPAFFLVNFFVAGAMFMAKKFRLLSFCLLWFFGNLLLESSLIGLEIMFEHRTYLPSLLLVLFFVQLQHLFAPKWVNRLIVLSLFVLFSTWTYERNSIWADKVALWEDSLQKHPADIRSYNSLGQALEEKGKINKAIDYYLAAIRVDPDHVHAYNNLGIALSRKGDNEAALENLNIALSKDPYNPLTNYNLALVYTELGYLKDAVKHYDIAHENSMDGASINVDVHNNLGVLFSKMGRFEEAIGHFKEALEMDPGNVDANNNLAVAYTRIKQYSDAVRYFQAALEINGKDPDLHTRLGLALMILGDKEAARRHFLDALRLKPGHQMAMFNLQRLGPK